MISLETNEHINLNIEGGIEAAGPSMSDDSLLYITQGTNLRTYNLASGQLGSPIDTATTKTMPGPYMACSEKYCFFSDDVDEYTENIIRIDLKSGERKQFQTVNDTSHMREMQIIKPKNYPQGLLAMANCFYGFELYDCESLERIYHNDFGEEG